MKSRLFSVLSMARIACTGLSIWCVKHCSAEGGSLELMLLIGQLLSNAFPMSLFKKTIMVNRQKEVKQISSWKSSCSCPSSKRSSVIVSSAGISRFMLQSSLDGPLNVPSIVRLCRNKLSEFPATTANKGPATAIPAWIGIEGAKCADENLVFGGHLITSQFVDPLWDCLLQRGHLCTGKVRPETAKGEMPAKVAGEHAPRPVWTFFHTIKFYKLEFSAICASNAFG